ncbi:hypothetical protein F5877DRAFT_72698 [Lentinula edodes]|nr:hypothetical protein F5877DRAFT_72698 [Lentinula edodes]
MTWTKALRNTPRNNLSLEKLMRAKYEGAAWSSTMSLSHNPSRDVREEEVRRRRQCVGTILHVGFYGVLPSENTDDGQDTAATLAPIGSSRSKKESPPQSDPQKDEKRSFLMIVVSGPTTSELNSY